MVAEPPRNEGETRDPIKDNEGSNTKLLQLPRKGIANITTNNNNSLSGGRTPPPPLPPCNGGHASSTASSSSASSSSSSPLPPPSSSSSSPSPYTTATASSSTTASSVCDSNQPLDIGSGGGGQNTQLHHPVQTSSSSSLSEADLQPCPQEQQHQHPNHSHHLPSCRDQQQVPSYPIDSPRRYPEGGEAEQLTSSSPTSSASQMTTAPQHLQERGEGPTSPPSTAIVITPDMDVGTTPFCSIAAGDNLTEGERALGEDECPSPYSNTALLGGRRSSNKMGNLEEEEEEEFVKGGKVSSLGRLNSSCGSVNSTHSGLSGSHGSSKLSVGKPGGELGQVWVRRGGTMPDLSEFERVWEAAPEVIIKPATLASSETLTPTEALTPTPTHTLDSLSEAPVGGISAHGGSVASDPSAFHEDPQEIVVPRGSPDSWSQVPEDLVMGAVGGGGHACGCGIEMGVLDELCGRCPTCPAAADVYVSEQFPSSDPLECSVDGSTHTLHVDLTTGEVQLHMTAAAAAAADPEKGVLQAVPTSAVPCDATTKCLHHHHHHKSHPCGMNLGHPNPTTSRDSEGQPAKKPYTFSSGIGEASVWHALVVIFLEFFAWGLLMIPMITVLNETFPDHTFLMNGLIVGIKGILSFLSAPLIGALSDLWGRKFFLFITVFFTCLPIPFMKINTWWYFALISMSGVFAVTFSIVFAYVADVTDENERSSAYGQVAATFAASLVTSPALGAYIGRVHSNDLVVGLATAIAILDVFFILVAVPESLPEKLRLSSSWSAHISWEQADPFSALWKVSKDKNVLLISVSVFLSYLPEAGQYSCFFVYLKLVMGFTDEMVATFIAAVGILSVVAQTVLLTLLMKKLSNKSVIIVGLVFEMLQLMWYGFGSKVWMMWAAGLLAAVSSITYPAISAYVSTHTDADKQGVVQGIITGMRGLCSGLGPAVFGFIFYIFHVDLNMDHADVSLHGPNGSSTGNSTTPHITSPNMIPGPPFVFGAFLVICALLVAAFIPDKKDKSSSKNRKQSGGSLDLSYERGHKKDDSIDAASLPLMDETGIL